jgi:hypothetical protein
MVHPSVIEQTANKAMQRLAEITYNSGDPKEAVVMLDRAIEMYSNVKD